MAVFQLFGDGSQGHEVVVIRQGLVPLEELPPGTNHEVFLLILEYIFHGVGLVGVLHHTRREYRVGGLDIGVPMVDADDDGLSHRAPPPF